MMGREGNFDCIMESLVKILQAPGMILIAGIGNLLRKDDGVGVYVSENLTQSSFVKVIRAEMSIENYIGKINQINPDKLVLVDCVDFNRKPGYANLVSADQLMDHTSHTHNVSLKKLNLFFDMPVYVLGIQPSDISFGEGLSPVVKKTADKLLLLINTFKNARTNVGGKSSEDRS